MKTLEIIFWILTGLIVYTYLGYGVVLFFMVQMKRLFGKKKKATLKDEDLPHITLLVAAFNEQDYVDRKVENSKKLNYPADKLHLMWCTDGSDDKTVEFLQQYPEIEVLHRPERRGKIAAMNRAMQFVKTPIVVFSDANTLLGEQSVMKIALMFSDPKVGCVSGEKRIFNDAEEAASAAGEGIYWKYESTLKRWDAELYSAVGAAGELFAIRTELYNEVEPDTLLDDFIISLRVAMKGFKIDYDPDAYAIEKASANVKEELKRKIRISAGGIQSVIRLYPLLNIFKYGILAFQYISHRVLRWTLTPLSLILLFFVNAFLAPYSTFFAVVMILQVLFYVMALTGWFLENRKMKVKALFIPYYFFIMNYAVFMGFFRYIKKTQSVNWERAKRAQ